MIRSKLFTLNGLQGSRAWFDFPVLAWLSRSLDGGLLASLASSLRLPLDFGALQWEGNFLTLPIPEGFSKAILPGMDPYFMDPYILEPPALDAGTETSPASSSEKWCHGPFPSGKGMFCAVMDERATRGNTAEDGRAGILAEATRLAGTLPRANIYSIALIELRWYPGPNYGSSWAILSSAVAGKTRPTKRPVLVNTSLA